MLNITPDRAEALRYLGIRTPPDDNLLALINQCEGELLATAAPRYIYRVFPLENSALIGCSFPLIGNDIVVWLDGCEYAVLFCAGLGEGVDRLLRASQLEDMARAVVQDALASAAVETLCNSVEDEICTEVAKKHECNYHTARFSPGYGDFPLKVQKDFLAVLNASKGMGLFVNEGSCLVPTKSVTAIIGFSRKKLERESQGFGSCEDCNLNENCAYRKDGGRCGL